MTLWMVSGLHDPRWLGNIIENYSRQSYQNKGLIIVENGQGIGATHPEKGDRCSIILRSEPGPAQPLNKALQWLRMHARPGDWFCKADSDDYYSPSYLSSITQAIEAGADYCGRSSLYIRTTNDHLWFVEGKPDAHVFHGPTIAGRILTALDFPLVQDWGEDASWCEVMHQDGKVPHTLPPEGVCYQRWKNYQHTWPCTDFEIRSSWRATFRDLGPMDFEIVDGKKPRPVGTILEAPEFSTENSMAVRILLERFTPFMPFRVMRQSNEQRARY